MPIYEPTDIPRVRVLGERIAKLTRQRDILAAALKYIEQKGRAKISDDDWNDVAYTAFDALREAGMEEVIHV